MIKDKLCIIVPIYKEKPSASDAISLKSIYDNAGNKTDIWFVGPQGINAGHYETWNKHWKLFDAKYFKSENTYSRLLLTTNFYLEFSQYEYMLICQTDALLLKPIEEIEMFFSEGYDYYGAPWFEGRKVYQYSFKGLSFVKKYFNEKSCYVGNGGFSLRNINKTILLLNEKKKYRRFWNSGEDVFFAYHGLENKSGYRIAPIEVAKKFALEQYDEKDIFYEIKPLGIHAWEKYHPEIMCSTI